MFKKIIFFSFFLSVQINGMLSDRPIKTSNPHFVQADINTNFLKDKLQTIAAELDNINLICKIENSDLSSNACQKDIAKQLKIDHSVLHLLISISNTKDYISGMLVSKKDSFYTAITLLDCNMQILESIKLNIESKIRDKEEIPENTKICFDESDNIKQILTSVYKQILSLKKKLDTNQI